MEQTFSQAGISLPVLSNEGSQIRDIKIDLTSSEIINRFPLRIAVTDYCNAKCVFCSNDGLGETRNINHVDVDEFSYLINVLSSRGLSHISLSGGDPTLHPNINELVKAVNKTGVEKRYFHTNGVLLNRNGLLNELCEFTKIGVSIHSLDREVYTQAMGLKRRDYDKTIENLSLLRKLGLERKVEIKHVPMKGINSSSNYLKQTLDYASENGFRFKFLNLEAIEPEHLKMREDLETIAKRLEDLGATLLPEKGIRFRGQGDYLPIKNYTYKNVEGVLIDIGCGRPSSCRPCYKSNEICITPRLDIKPCNTSPYIIPLKDAIQHGDSEEIIKRIVDSRKFLATKPGLNNKYWNQKQK